MVAGAAVAVLGALIWLGERVGIRLGRLPGDIAIYGRNSTFIFPLGTCVLLSLLLSLIVWLGQRGR